MSAKSEIDGKVFQWRQGTVIPGGFGQISVGNWIEIPIVEVGGAEVLVGEKATFSFTSGTNAGRTWDQTISKMLPGNGGFWVEDQWALASAPRVLFGSGLVKISFPAPPPVVTPDPPSNPTGSLPTPDPLDKYLDEFFGESMKPNDEVNAKVHCNSNWWLLLLAAALAYLTLKKR